MRRRLTVAFVGVVAGALLVAGIGTYYLDRQGAAATARQTILSQAETLATSVSNPINRDVRELFGRLADIPTPQLVYLHDGNLKGTAPDGLDQSDLDTGVLTLDRAVSGVKGNLAYAVVPVVDPAATARGDEVAVLLVKRVQYPNDSATYLAIASALSLLAAAAVAVLLGRRFSLPVVEAAHTAQRMAGGDLSARMTAKPSPYPELFNLGQSIDSLAESLEQARGAERQFLLSISHDLRTPLTSIRGYAEALSDGTATDVGRAAAIMASEAARLERLIRDLLDLARLDARTFSLDLQPVDVGEVAGTAAEGLRFQLDGAGVDLVVRVPVDPLWALADADRLAQIVANLVENAFKFARSRVELSVSADSSGSVLLAVEDNGPGIPPDDLPRVFERLYTANRHAARAGGTGLGLSIVAELAAAMGGDVEVRSPTGLDGGTAFLVRLRRSDGDGPREPAALSSPAARVPPSTVPSA